MRCHASGESHRPASVRVTGQKAAASTLALFGFALPPEIFDALELSPHFLNPEQATVQQEDQAADLSQVCSHCRSLIGYLENLKQDQHPRAILAATHCDQARRTIELIARHFAIPAHILSLPQTRTANARALFQERFKECVAWLEKRFERTLEPPRLNQSIEKWNAIREECRCLRERLSFGDFIAHGFALLSNRTPPAPLNKSARTKNPLRLFLAGSCMTVTEARTLERMLPEAILAESFLPPLDMLLHLKIAPGPEPLSRLADASFDLPWIGDRPNRAYFEQITNQAQAAKVDGVIFRVLRFCDLCEGESRALRESFQPLPLLHLNTDNIGADEARLKNRLDAFLEQLLDRRNRSSNTKG